jgi:hypothetical protein
MEVGENWSEGASGASNEKFGTEIGTAATLMGITNNPVDSKFLVAFIIMFFMSLHS